MSEGASFVKGALHKEVDNVELSDEQKQLLRRGIELNFKAQKNGTMSQSNIEGSINFTNEFILFQATSKSSVAMLGGKNFSKSLLV